MFTWICPKCGREVPPSYSECPDCAKQVPAAEQPPVEAPQALPPTKPRINQEKIQKVPSWMLATLFALVFVIIGATIFLVSRQLTGNKNPKADADFTSPPSGLDAPAKPSSYGKYVEVTGFRITEDKGQKLQVEFLVVNHSAAEIANVAGEVTLKTKGEPTAKPLARFAFKIPSLAPYGAENLKATAQTGLRAYELPDWQFLNADVLITSP